jgi:response regulator RpfG family c-di-GMP phosphodiesterase
MESTHLFLIINDEEAAVQSLERMINKVFPDSKIYSVSDGLDGLEMIKKFKNNSIIICDLFLPNLNGLQLLQKVKLDNIAPDSFFFISTTKADIEENLKAIQYGADALIYKPFSIDEFISKMKFATKILSLNSEIIQYRNTIKSFESQLDYEIQNTIAILEKLIINKMPGSVNITNKILESSLFIAYKLGTLERKEISDLEKAARLIFLGKLALREKFLDDPIMKNGLLANQTMLQVPLFAHDILSKIRGYENAALILKHIFENFDGSGIPQQLQSRQIPIASRILRVAYDYEELLIINNKNYDKTIEQIYHENKRLYDYRIVAFYDQYLASKSRSNTGKKEKPVSIKDLKEGNILSRNILINSGLVLLISGTHLRFEQIEKIEAINQADPIIGDIYIYSY